MAFNISQSMALPGESNYQRKQGYTVNVPTASGSWHGASQQKQSPQALATSQATERANKENKARELEVRKVLDEIIGIYRQGGSFGKGVEAQLGRERTQTLASGGQSLVNSGLYNTTQLAGLSTQFAENVAAPTRMKLEDLRMDRLSGALGQKASFVEGISNEQPDYRMLAQLLQGM